MIRPVINFQISPPYLKQGDTVAITCPATSFPGPVGFNDITVLHSHIQALYRVQSILKNSLVNLKYSELNI